MKLPNAEKAIIPEQKLTRYLLSGDAGGGKARFFAALGYNLGNWRALEAALRRDHLPADAQEVAPTKHGRKFIIRKELTGTLGVSESVLSIWIIRHGENQPRLVSAYPEKGRR